MYYYFPCLSVGVPVSTQWGSQGYYYPIQIAQYGLSHYSKHLAATEPRTVSVLSDVEQPGSEHRWLGAPVSRVYDEEAESYVLVVEGTGKWG